MPKATPQVRIRAECAQRGRAAVVDGCVAILRGEEPDPALLLALGGPATPRLLAGESRADLELWSRVWAARGLLWALDPDTVVGAEDAIVDALDDPSWRVREKAAQVVARHLVDGALDAVVSLSERESVQRVRTAADRAVRRLTAGELERGRRRS